MLRKGFVVGSFTVALLGLAGCGSDEAETPNNSAGATGGTDAGGGTGGSDPLGGNGGTDAGGGTGGTNAGGGTGGNGGGGEEFVFGAPVTAAPLTWTWVPVPESRCMNDTPTGFGVNLNPDSKRVVIILQGGNACFNGTSCAITANTRGYGETQFNKDKSSFSKLGAFDRADDTTPFKDWNQVMVPYCTGDVHAGTRSGVKIGANTWNFHGYQNMHEFLERIVPTFPNAELVVLTGLSAGGFGAALNMTQTQTAFRKIPVVVLDDSGPPMGNQYLAPCLQKHFRDTWGLDGSLPKDCADCFPADGSFTEGYLKYVGTHYPDSSFGVLSNAQDKTIGMFWGYGKKSCASISSPTGMPDAYPGTEFEAGLVDLRDRLLEPYSNMKLFMKTGTDHVLLGDSPGTVKAADGTLLSDWLEGAIDGASTWDHAPKGE